MRNIQIAVVLASLMLILSSPQAARAGCGAVLTVSMGSHIHFHRAKEKRTAVNTANLAGPLAAKPSPTDGSEAAYEQSVERISPALNFNGQR